MQTPTENAGAKASRRRRARRLAGPLWAVAFLVLLVADPFFWILEVLVERPLAWLYGHTVGRVIAPLVRWEHRQADEREHPR